MGGYLSFKRELEFLFFVGKSLNNVVDLSTFYMIFYITMKPGRNSQICFCFCFTFLLAPDSEGRCVSLPELSEK